MNGRDNRDDHLFLWCAFLILVFVVLPALYIAHADSVNRPLLALAKAQIQSSRSSLMKPNSLDTHCGS